MSGRQFENILSYLNCSESIINPEDTPCLKKILLLFNLVIPKFQKSYVPTQNLSLDESIK